jgi:hypothetical protein
MRIEWWIIISVYLIATVILLFIPKKRFRLAIFALLCKQVITYFIGLVVVELGLLEYPVRCFESVNRTSFLYEYYAYPVVCAAFNAWYPNNRRPLFRFGYYVGYCSVLTMGEVIIEKHTQLIKYIHWEWYITWITLFITFYIVRLLCVWFFTKERVSNM